MKAPRDLLINQHRAAEPQLDSIRAEVVRGLVQPTSAPSIPDETMVGLLQTCWEELFVASRRWWTGLGMAWCVILIFVVVGSAGQGERGKGGSVRSEPMLQAMQEHWQMRDELLGMVATQHTRTPRPGPGPRSDIICEERYV